MKALLGSLLCLVLFASECFAIKGGPPYPGGTVNIVGTYAGVLEPRFDPTDPFSTNSLGIFSLGVPSTGLSNGAFVMFTHGVTFGGTIQGVGDPAKGLIKGVLSATFSPNTSQTVLTDIFGDTVIINSGDISARAEGSLSARVTTSSGSSFLTSAALIKGSAIVFVTESATVTNEDGTTQEVASITAALALDVLGFKQSNTATVSSGTSGGSGG